MQILLTKDLWIISLGLLTLGHHWARPLVPLDNFIRFRKGVYIRMEILRSVRNYNLQTNKDAFADQITKRQTFKQYLETTTHTHQSQISRMPARDDTVIKRVDLHTPFQRYVNGEYSSPIKLSLTKFSVLEIELKKG
ncbi:hypothetical protein [Bacillus sp. SG-1]|uniref:hypothetical protein n=1 Tax=Bacillus sp. SG-1 TaxID=161544 RepID=UPI0001545656|nr:hypothetical protein [Bacillus sp. SG-1]EDL62808.1 hypothetical protein BSG1_20230 [Bacillus sp. SG-1]